MGVFAEDISSGEVKKEAEDSLEVQLENERDDGLIGRLAKNLFIHVDREKWRRLLVRLAVQKRG